MAERATGWVDKNGMHFATEAEADASNASIDLDAWLLAEGDTVALLFGRGLTTERVVRVSDLRAQAKRLLPLLAAYVKAQASNG